MAMESEETEEAECDAMCTGVRRITSCPDLPQHKKLEIDIETAIAIVMDLKEWHELKQELSKKGTTTETIGREYAVEAFQILPDPTRTKKRITLPEMTEGVLQLCHTHFKFVPKKSMTDKFVYNYADVFRAVETGNNSLQVDFTPTLIGVPPICFRLTTDIPDGANSVVELIKDKAKMQACTDAVEAPVELKEVLTSAAFIAPEFQYWTTGILHVYQDRFVFIPEEPAQSSPPAAAAAAASVFAATSVRIERDFQSVESVYYDGQTEDCIVIEFIDNLYLTVKIRFNDKSLACEFIETVKRFAREQGTGFATDKVGHRVGTRRRLSAQAAARAPAAARSSFCSSTPTGATILRAECSCSPVTLNLKKPTNVP
uniref:Uncharacterized protein n=1 Tax=Vitrella brassicaformis TaxID=1169539 RepID=A0A6U4ECU6_9ALVE